MKKRTKNAAKSAALIGVMAATVECSKLALAAIPNVEVVSLLIALYSYTFGTIGITASLVFVLIEPLVWGFGSWFISYLIYWPALAAVFALLGRVRVKNRFLLTLTAVAMTFLFGVLTSLVDIGLFSGYFDNFAYRFFVYYARGVWFYAAQIITNAILFPTLFFPLSRLLLKIKGKLFY